MSASEYRDGMALWRSVSDRARTAAKTTGRPANELVRRFVYGRFLARVFADPTAPWVLKGGTAVLARVKDARHTMDVDLLRRLGDLNDALEALRSAAATDLEDHFRFVVASARPLGGAAQQPQLAGYRVTMHAYCGSRRCETFGVDLVTGSQMTREPDVVQTKSPLEVPGVSAPIVRAYPVVDHIADKVAATEAVYFDGERSSRVRDLVDLVVFARTQVVDGEALSTAIAAERLHRGLPAAAMFTVPRSWARERTRIWRQGPHTAQTCTTWTPPSRSRRHWSNPR